jgi:uncharacterized protein
MFGPPSLSKILLLALIVALVWGAFGLIGRLQRARREEERRMAQQPRPPARARAVKAEDMILCPRCGAYYPPSVPHSCGRG